jgi:hypothetical protein
MLHRPDAAAMTIAEVAERCGFGSVTHFSRSFALRFGEPASDVRRYGRWRRDLASSYRHYGPYCGHGPSPNRTSLPTSAVNQGNLWLPRDISPRLVCQGAAN